jgi:hypothetical protein
MLEPRERRPFTDMLRPPTGYQFDQAIGTSFSLDLLALLTAPLAFTMFDWEENPTDHPLRLLDAIRRYADRITIFCQAGQIAVPRPDQPLYTYLEQTVCEAIAPSPMGAFHPKIWVLRFTGDAVAVRYRFLCLSRNLTFDQAWDTALALDGKVTPSWTAPPSQIRLADFISRLPDQSLRGASETIRDRASLLADELRRVCFMLPPGFTDLAFWPLGIDSTASWPFAGPIDRLLVISPFLTETCIARLSSQGRQHILISRPEAIDVLRPSTLATFKQCYMLHPDAESETSADSEEQSELRGLHAKLYLAESGNLARLWSGSANATHAAFNQNVEFLVELHGPKAQYGIDALLSRPKDRLGLCDLLAPYTPDTHATPPDSVQAACDKLADDIRRNLTRMGLVAQAVPAQAPDQFTLTICRPSGTSTLPHGVTVRCWPITVREGDAVPLQLSAKTCATFGPFGATTLTPFIAFALHVRTPEASTTVRFVLTLPLKGAPPNRTAQILRSFLREPAQVLRFLLLILGDPDTLAAEDAGTTSVSLEVDSLTRDPLFDAPLFERLVQALARNSSRLDHVARAIEELQATANEENRLPERLTEIWEPIWAMRNRLREGGAP